MLLFPPKNSDVLSRPQRAFQHKTAISELQFDCNGVQKSLQTVQWFQRWNVKLLHAARRKNVVGGKSWNSWMTLKHQRLRCAAIDKTRVANWNSLYYSVNDVFSGCEFPNFLIKFHNIVERSKCTGGKNDITTRHPENEKKEYIYSHVRQATVLFISL